MAFKYLILVMLGLIVISLGKALFHLSSAREASVSVQLSGSEAACALEKAAIPVAPANKVLLVMPPSELIPAAKLNHARSIQRSVVFAERDGVTHA